MAIIALTGSLLAHLVSPASGETFWYVSNGVSKEFFAALRETFAREAEAGLARIIRRVRDNAAAHQFPLVAKANHTELITRKSCHSPGGRAW